MAGLPRSESHSWAATRACSLPVAPTCTTTCNRQVFLRFLGKHEQGVPCFLVELPFQRCSQSFESVCQKCAKHRLITGGVREVMEGTNCTRILQGRKEKYQCCDGLGKNKAELCWPPPGSAAATQVSCICCEPQELLSPALGMLKHLGYEEATECLPGQFNFLIL